MMKKSKEQIPAHIVLDLMKQGVFLNQGHLTVHQLERKMKAAQAKGGDK